MKKTYEDLVSAGNNGLAVAVGFLDLLVGLSPIQSVIAADPVVARYLGHINTGVWECADALKQLARLNVAATVESVGTLRVLVIDDQLVNLQLMGELLGIDNHHVTIASTGQAGLEALAAGTFDLVFTDRQMPIMDGDQFAQAARAAHPDIPIIMLTAFGDGMNYAGELPSGVSLVLAKPVGLEILRRTIAEVTGQGRQKPIE